MTSLLLLLLILFVLKPQFQANHWLVSKCQIQQRQPLASLPSSLLQITKNPKNPSSCPLGKDITGRALFGNLGKAPHMLIAGTTGSGKSVTIHALITSLLYRNSPENLKFIMIDPKRVELTMYNKIPHLLTPVITDPKKAILALKWAAKEMSRRYDVLEKNSARDIDSYHKSILGPAIEKAKSESTEDGPDTKGLPESMPYIAIFIDELADIMQTYPRELESAIVRLAQMSRARRYSPCNIHPKTKCKCHHWSHQSQYPKPYCPPSIIADRFSNDSRPDGSRKTPWSWRHALSRRRDVQTC
jgi:DNA polymerase III delta prime subunit